MSCIEVEPCEHDIYKNGKFVGSWNSVSIVKFLREHGQHIPQHFTEYDCSGEYDDPGLELFA
jgi:hypothetical protein